MKNSLETDMALMMFSFTLRHGGEKQIPVLYSMLISKDGPEFIEDMVNLYIKRDTVLRKYLVKNYGESPIEVYKPYLLNTLAQISRNYLNANARRKRS